MSKNDITGDWIKSKPNSEMFEEGWDRIFGKKKVLEQSIKDNEELYKKLSLDDMKEMFDEKFREEKK
jgi:hypothetical protein